MSDKNENEGAHYKKGEDKKSNSRLKEETSAEKKDSVSGESGKFEECSGKNPKLKKDLKELFDNFGQETDSQANKTPLCSVETSETVKKDITSESYSEQCLENLVSTDEFSKANNKDSFETTLDGKFIGVNDSCNCHEIKCTCSQTDHNITDIEESQVCYKRNEAPPYDFYTVLPAKHAYVVKECDYENPRDDITNRYNYNQVQIRHHRKGRTRCSKLFPRRTKMNKSHVSKNDSGETIPQLYKANVKHLRNYGFVPEKFTFRAVTGNLPGQLEYRQVRYHHPGQMEYHHHGTDPCYHPHGIDPSYHPHGIDPSYHPHGNDPSYHPHGIDPSYHPYFQTSQKVNFVDDNVIHCDDNIIHCDNNIIHPDQQKLKKERKCIFKPLKRNKNKDPERNNLKYNHNLEHHAPSMHRTKKNYKTHNNFDDFHLAHHAPNIHRAQKNYKIDNKYDDFFDQACLPFEGNEYISNKQLPDRIDIYCFDHLNTSYFRTCDQPPPLITDIAMEKTEEVATRFWAEIFGFIHVIIAFFIAFLLQLYKFLLYSIVRPIMVGLVQLTSDYFFKPLLTITYNGFTQPFLVFLFNVAASFRDLCLPIAKGLGYFVSEIAVLLRAIRLADCGKNASYQMKDSCC